MTSDVTTLVPVTVRGVNVENLRRAQRDCGRLGIAVEGVGYGDGGPTIDLTGSYDVVAWLLLSWGHEVKA